MPEEQIIKPQNQETVPQNDGVEHKKPVVTGKVTVKKKSEGRKFLETFFEGDIKQVGKSVWQDLLVPAVKDMLYGALDQAFRGMIYRDYASKGRDRREDRYGAPARREDFTRYSDRRNMPERTRSNREDVYDYGELFFERRDDAENAKLELYDLLERYGTASVGHLYEVAGLKMRQTDFNYGWRNRDTREIYVDTCRGGYLLRTPRPKALD